MKCALQAAARSATASASDWCPPWERSTKGISPWCARPGTQCDQVVASIFVNPLQFGPNEDLAKYPRNFERDRELLAQEGVDFVFAPGVEEMYPAGAVTYVTVEGLSDKLCGRSRPGHFRGVTTVVAKLFNIVEPDRAYFGQKDAAQSTIIRRMVRDLNIPVEVVVCPIVREPDGLAMSSRNAYLDAPQRQAAAGAASLAPGRTRAFRSWGTQGAGADLRRAGRHSLRIRQSGSTISRWLIPRRSIRLVISRAAPWWRWRRLWAKRG